MWMEKASQIRVGVGGGIMGQSAEAGNEPTCVRCIEGINNLVGMIKIIWGAVLKCQCLGATNPFPRDSDLYGSGARPQY